MFDACVRLFELNGCCHSFGCCWLITHRRILYQQNLKKENDNLSLELRPTKDIAGQSWTGKTP